LDEILKHLPIPPASVSVTAVYNFTSCVCCWRAHARKLALENEALHDQVRQTEKDTVEVLSFLKGQDEHKNEQVSKAKHMLHILFQFNETQG